MAGNLVWVWICTARDSHAASIVNISQKFLRSCRNEHSLWSFKVFKSFNHTVLFRFLLFFLHFSDLCDFERYSIDPERRQSKMIWLVYFRHNAREKVLRQPLSTVQWDAELPITKGVFKNLERCAHPWTFCANMCKPAQTCANMCNEVPEKENWLTNHSCVLSGYNLYLLGRCTSNIKHFRVVPEFCSA